METFADWLIRELNARDWKPADLASMADISRGSLSNILSDMRRPGPDVCTKIADALGLPQEIVFRAAGILRPAPTEDKTVEEIKYTVSQLSAELKEDVHKYAKWRLTQVKK